MSCEHEAGTSTSHGKGPAPPALNLSRASEAYRYFPAFDDNGNLAPVVGIFQHALKAFCVLEDIDVVEGDLTPGVFRTGSRSIGSEILPKDQNLVRSHRYFLSLSQQGSNCKEASNIWGTTLSLRFSVSSAGTLSCSLRAASKLARQRT